MLPCAVANPIEEIATLILFEKSLVIPSLEVCQQKTREGSLWSAVTSHRFGLSRPVAATIRLKLFREFGARPPQAKAATGRRTPKAMTLPNLRLSRAPAAKLS